MFEIPPQNGLFAPFLHHQSPLQRCRRGGHSGSFSADVPCCLYLFGGWPAVVLNGSKITICPVASWRSALHYSHFSRPAQLHRLSRQQRVRQMIACAAISSGWIPISSEETLPLMLSARQHEPCGLLICRASGA